MPSFCGRDDVRWLRSSLEWRGLLTMGFGEDVDGLLQRHHRVEDAASQATLGELGEEALRPKIICHAELAPQSPNCSTSVAGAETSLGS